MKQLILTLPILLLLTGCQETTYQTGIPGVVVKNIECVDEVPATDGARYGVTGKGITFNLVNRISKQLYGSLSVTVFDYSGDPVGQGYSHILLDANSGDR